MLFNKHFLTSYGKSTVLVSVAAICLVVLNFQGNAFAEPLAPILKPFGWLNSINDWLFHHPEQKLHQKLWWIGWTILCYFVGPCAAALGLGIKLSDLGLKLPPRSDWKIYLGLYGLMLPAIWLASRTVHFQEMYPFYTTSHALNSWQGARNQFLWEMAYALQFVALEFFFRGFITLGLKPTMGFASVFVMVIPYVMIHFGKPQAEAFGSLFAGLALGFLSWKSESIWGGAALHIAVAWTMDAFAF